MSISSVRYGLKQEGDIINPAYWWGSIFSTYEREEGGGREEKEINLDWNIVSAILYIAQGTQPPFA